MLCVFIKLSIPALSVGIYNNNFNSLSSNSVENHESLNLAKRFPTGVHIISHNGMIGSGVIIKEDWILTVGHCTNPKEVRTSIGEVIQVDFSITHPDYKIRSYYQQKDLQLLHLSSKTKIKPSVIYSGQYHDGYLYWATGYGYSNKNKNRFSGGGIYYAASNYYFHRHEELVTLCSQELQKMFNKTTYQLPYLWGITMPGDSGGALFINDKDPTSLLPPKDMEDFYNHFQVAGINTAVSLDHVSIASYINYSLKLSNAKLKAWINSYIEDESIGSLLKTSLKPKIQVLRTKINGSTIPINDCIVLDNRQALITLNSKIPKLTQATPLSHSKGLKLMSIPASYKRISKSSLSSFYLFEIPTYLNNKKLYITTQNNINEIIFNDLQDHLLENFVLLPNSQIFCPGVYILSSENQYLLVGYLEPFQETIICQHQQTQKRMWKIHWLITNRVKEIKTFIKDDLQ